MINLKDALITDGLPPIIAEETWAQAMAKAVRSEMRKILEYAKVARLYAAIDQEPENVIDLMAKDLQVQEYSQDYNLDLKRALVKIALQRWSKAGTKSAVQELCTKIFGDAVVIEWYEYEGDPFYFKVTCNSVTTTEEDVVHFRRAVDSIKRLSAWLENVELIINIPAHPNIMGFAQYMVKRDHFEIEK